MASSSRQTLGHLNQVRDSSSLGNNIRRGFSTAQMCLKRILEIISSVPPCESDEEEEDKELSDPKEEEVEVEVEVDNKDERNAEFGSETLPFKRKAYDGSISSSSSSDCLDLLVEAAKLISANTGDDEEEEEEEEEKESKKKKKKKESRMVMGEGSAVVRSTRGRNQALPSRLRDSVLEPWIRLPPRPPHSHRSTQQTTTTRRRRSS